MADMVRSTPRGDLSQSPLQMQMLKCLHSMTAQQFSKQMASPPLGNSAWPDSSSAFSKNLNTPKLPGTSSVALSYVQALPSAAT